MFTPGMTANLRRREAARRYGESLVARSNGRLTELVMEGVGGPDAIRQAILDGRKPPLEVLDELRAIVPAARLPEPGTRLFTSWVSLTETAIHEARKSDETSALTRTTWLVDSYTLRGADPLALEVLQYWLTCGDERMVESAAMRARTIIGGADVAALRNWQSWMSGYIDRCDGEPGATLAVAYATALRPEDVVTAIPYLARGLKARNAQKVEEALACANRLMTTVGDSANSHEEWFSVADDLIAAADAANPAHGDGLTIAFAQRLSGMSLDNGVPYLARALGSGDPETASKAATSALQLAASGRRSMVALAVTLHLERAVEQDAKVPINVRGGIRDGRLQAESGVPKWHSLGAHALAFAFHPRVPVATGQETPDQNQLG